MTGAQAAAEAVLRNSGVTGVGIRPSRGSSQRPLRPALPKTLNLSQRRRAGHATVAALGVAAHEAGHAVPGRSRLQADAASAQTLVPAASIGSQLVDLPADLPRASSSARLGLVNVGLVLFLADRALPARHPAGRVRRLAPRASSRSRAAACSAPRSSPGPARCCSAAALTYVAALAASIGQLIYFFIASRR